MRIALDAMGGDHAPQPIVTGAMQAAERDSDLIVTLVGDRAQVEQHLTNDYSGRLVIHHCTEAVGMHESPVDALRKKPDSSIAQCWRLLAEGQVDGMVSAGNTGAVVAAGFRLRRFLKNVRRPGIATVMPTMRGPCVILDVGANVNPKPIDLYQYGVMGSIYASHVLKRETPSIGLMNIGSEQEKGHGLAKETHQLFNASPLRSRFIGNIEGRDIHRGVCDVVVADGFVGNVILKVCEGVFDFCLRLVADELLTNLTEEREKANNVLKNLIAKYHYSETGGAPLLGIDGVCIICHGSSKERAIFNAMGVATRFAATKVNAHIVQDLEIGAH